jgi:hypothetical protein
MVRRVWPVLVCCVLGSGCARPATLAAPEPPGVQPRVIVLPPPLPDTSGWGVPVLTLAQSPDGAIWAGTHGHGLLRYSREEGEWQRVPLGIAADAAITSLAFADGALWYGSAGHGFGRIPLDGLGSGVSARVWPLPAGWSWVPLNGVAAHGSLVAVATAAGTRVSEDGGDTWRCVVGAIEPDPVECGAVVRLPASRHALTLHVDAAARIWVGHTSGISVSADGGRTWGGTDALSGLPLVRVRGIVVSGERVWAATESQLYEGDARTLRFRPAGMRLLGYSETERLPGSTRALIPGHGGRWPAIATSQGLLAPAPEGTGAYRHYRSTSPGGGDVYAALWWGEPYSPFAGTGTGLDSYLAAFPLRQPLNDPWCREADARPSDDAGARCTRTSLPRVLPTVARHPLLQRPIGGEGGNPFANPLRPPALAGGALSFHTGVGTPVRAVAAGTIEASAPLLLRLDAPWREHTVLVRYDGIAPVAEPGARVRAGAVIGTVAADAREPPALRLHLLLVPPDPAADSLRLNPALWLQPPDGTGTLAARVADEHGRLLAGARLHRLYLAQPAETPYAFAVSYEAGIDPHPAWGENLVVSGVVPGEYFVAVEHDAHIIWRRVRIEAGRITVVEFAPD